MELTIREEQYLAKIVGEDTPVPEPKTRMEMFLAKAAGASITTPDPITKEEQIFSKMAESGGGGSSDFSTAQLKLVDAMERGSGQQTAIRIRCVIAAEDALRLGVTLCPISGEITIPIPMYKGKNITIIPDDLIGATSMPVLSGNITFSESEEKFVITGDCTITVS